MDTDSNYLEFSEDIIEKLIKLEMREEYEMDNYNFLLSWILGYIEKLKTIVRKSEELQGPTKTKRLRSKILRRKMMREKNEAWW